MENLSNFEMLMLKFYSSFKHFSVLLKFIYGRKIKIDSDNDLPQKKHWLIIHIKSVLNKDQNHYYHNIFLEKMYQLAKKKKDNFFW